MGNIDESTFMARYSAFNPYRLVNREMGFQTPIGAGDAMAKSLYCGMKPIASWDFDRAKALPTGGVFNLEFSPEGSLLVAACEKKSIQIFDPLTHQRIHSVNGAHSDCVNCVKFLDGRMFATCSDDTTIALWDVRNLKKKIRSLLGHSKWVKNIEFSVKDKLLVTSGLDGSIYTWDINCYTEYNLVYQRVFHTSSLMRCRLSPDAKQMVMCTTGGLLVIIHDLNLSTLAQDLHGFKPNLYRLMQMSQQVIPIAALHDHLFDASRKENRVEFVSDFPDGNDATVVSALQQASLQYAFHRHILDRRRKCMYFACKLCGIELLKLHKKSRTRYWKRFLTSVHPQGWSALSRNISHDDRSEWTCIHDIQPNNSGIDKSTRDSSPPVAPPLRRATPRRVPFRRGRPYRYPCRRPTPATPGEPSAPAPTPEEPAPSTSESQNQREGYREAASPEPGPSTAREASGPTVASIGASPAASSSRLAGGLSNIQNDVWEASITIKQHRMLQEMYSRGQVRSSFNMQRITGINTGITPPPLAPSTPTAVTTPAPPPRPLRPALPTNSIPSTSGVTPVVDLNVWDEDAATRHYIRQNRDRLLYYTEETNEGKGFIKELCYSADGRLVCSPFGRGMRLLALNENCSELPHCIQDFQNPRPLVDVGQSLGIHQDLVVSSKFSPRYHMLVTGCLEGRIVWYQPFSGESLY